MKRMLPLCGPVLAVSLTISCSHKSYTSDFFAQKTARHKLIAVLPAEMIFTGTVPKGLSAEDIEKIEETESRMFQNYLFSSILRHADSKRYVTNVGIQDISTTQKLLEENGISVRDSWTQDDTKLSRMLGVDAIVRLRIQKKRYMSDLASMGIAMGRQVLSQIGQTARFPVPHVSNKTNDIYASCHIVSEHQALWSDDYRGSSNYNHSSESVIDDITDNFGKRFPYRKRR